MIRKLLEQDRALEGYGHLGGRMVEDRVERVPNT